MQWGVWSSTPESSIPTISSVKYTKMHTMLSRFSHVQPSSTLWTEACQAPLPMGFSRQEYWSGLPFPSPRDIPNPGIKPRSPALQAESLASEPPGKPTHSKATSKCLGMFYSNISFHGTPKFSAFSRETIPRDSFQRLGSYDHGAWQF